MEQRRCNLGTGEEYKSPLMQPGMGKRQVPGLKDQIVVKKQIQIKSAFGPAFAAKAAMPAFDLVQYLQKGRQAYIEGRLQTRSWEGQDGQKRYKTEVVANTVLFLGSGGGGAARTERFDEGGGGGAGPAGPPVDPDDLPFE